MTESGLTASLADPARAALLVVDVQNDFIAPGGRSPGRDAYRAMVESALAPCVDAARALGVTIVWIRMENSAASLTPANLRTKARMFGIDPATPGASAAILERAVCQQGSWGAALYLAPHEGDLVVTKNRYSAFIGTPLASLLRDRQLQTVAVCGVVTNQCVESTVRDAYQLDFDAILLSDCVAESTAAAREASFANVASSFGLVLDSSELLATWSR